MHEVLEWIALGILLGMALAEGLQLVNSSRARAWREARSALRGDRW